VDNLRKIASSQRSYVKVEGKMVRNRGEPVLVGKLGSIKSVQVIAFTEFIFKQRVITDKMILRIETALNRQNLAEEVKAYDPWSDKWIDHCSRLYSVTVIKHEVDGGDLYAANLLKMLRECTLKEEGAEKTVDLNMEEEEESQFVADPPQNGWW